MPLNLERDEYFDTNIRNLIVLDDMATEASRDQRIIDLYTDRIHHRNRSVIALNQNLSLSKDPTQRRNTQYLVFFQ